ncbi:MAG: transcription-repair coupling factor [Gemmatimonadetes bacterium]|jgi:transcription-repair coupling factor (superfamily II helicase)|nr:transcription-repair coupling factor [Gemmatimonadota bacterium]
MDPARSLDDIARQTSLTPSFGEVIARLQRGDRQLLLHGLPTTLAAFLIAHVQRTIERPVLIVATDEDGAEKWRDDLQAIVGEQIVRYFPAWDTEIYDRRSPDIEITGLRLETIARLQRGEPTIVVAPAGALLSPLLPPHALELGSLQLSVDEEHSLDQISSHLTDCGFERVSMIDGIGQFSVRGGILDVYPFDIEHPLRIEFFDDEIESIRLFDVGTQRSLSSVQTAILLPARELLLTPDFYDEYLQRIVEFPEEHQAALIPLRDQLELGGSLEGIESFMPVLYGRDHGLFEYLRDPLVFCNERQDVDAELDKIAARPRKEYDRHPERHTHLPPELLLRDPEWLEAQLSARTRLEPAPVGSADQAVRFGAREPRIFQGELNELRQEIVQLDDQDFAIHMRCETQGQNSRLQEIFSPWAEQIAFGLGSLHRGFIFPEAQLALLNDHEIFSRQKRRYRYRKFKGGTPLASFNALQRGDFVVHVDHGIGRYLGIKRLRLGGREHDCLSVSYQGADKLFVPVEQLDRLRKYSSAEGDVPILSKLGGAAWERLKERTREEIFKMASELVQLYAERKALPGFRFAADSPMLHEVEAAFPFQETPDQQRTVEEVKKDMESAHPMDRLVCGDVGYGKTEVAVRAAFKAVCDHKQVAVLVPTTILAQQHFQTFSERLANTPVRVEVLSRFRTAKEQQQTLRDLRAGKVDIVIGTHRLLSKDVAFRDLGLLVVDEEQRFGVRHKEKLKQFKRLVDVITLTATPIPRTLHMSLMGSRDMSIINTPPQDRLPIHTEILAFDETRIAEAIYREVERGGQVYFVHNRVQPIHRLAEYLEELLPQVRFAVAHGQMSPRQLERIMFDFLERKYDCLVCTMIIESGIDIPSVNTILVNRADTLGLGQLYQIRGRVGRSNERAYAYLLVPKGKKLTKKSRMRLRAIEEFADLGSGFNIAMRDMEIRGAGNLVGPQQHGFIAAVGFDLYCRLLDEAMRDLKGESVSENPEPDVKIAVTAYIPDDYVPDGDQKMEFYQRLADAHRIVDLLAIREEMEDRFGRLPYQARSLMHIMEIRVMSRQLGLDAVHLEKSRFRLVFPEDRQLSPADVQRMVEKCSSQLEFDIGERLSIEIRVQGRDEIERLEKARDTLEEIL